jgi:hypothetical protein
LSKMKPFRDGPKRISGRSLGLGQEKVRTHFFHAPTSLSFFDRPHDATRELQEGSAAPHAATLQRNAKPSQSHGHQPPPPRVGVRLRSLPPAPASWCCSRPPAPRRALQLRAPPPHLAGAGGAGGRQEGGGRGSRGRQRSMLTLVKGRSRAAMAAST